MTIIKQGNIYHAQLAVPKDVQLVIGKKHFRKSLKTPDIKEAKRKVYEFLFTSIIYFFILFNLLLIFA